MQVLKPLDVKTKFYNAEVTPKHCRKHVHYFAPQFFFGGGGIKKTQNFFNFPELFQLFFFFILRTYSRKREKKAGISKNDVENYILN